VRLDLTQNYFTKTIKYFIINYQSSLEKEEKMIRQRMIVHGEKVAEFPESHPWLKGIKHGFSTFQAGNMSKFHGNWSPEALEKNRLGFYQEVGLDYSRRAVMLPEHEDGVGLVSGPGEVRGDALITDVPGLTLCLRPADCLPIIITNNNQQEKILALTPG